MKRILFAGIFGLLLCSQLAGQVSAFGVCVEGNYHISNPYYMRSNEGRGFGFGSGIDVHFKLSERFYLQTSIMYKRFSFSFVEGGRIDFSVPRKVPSIYQLVRQSSTPSEEA